MPLVQARWLRRAGLGVLLAATLTGCGGDDKPGTTFPGGTGGTPATGGSSTSGGADAGDAGGSSPNDASADSSDASAGPDARVDAGLSDASPVTDATLRADAHVRDGCVPIPEDCNGFDDDCDGEIDEGNPSGGANCATGLAGVCTAGTRTCVAGALICLPDTIEAVEECNGLDDDCNGEVDDGNPSGGAACTTGLPGICLEGTLTCAGGALICAPSVASTPEECNGLDDNCDGQADEGDPEGGGTCTTSGIGACATGTLVCVSGALACAETTDPRAERCNSVDDDCDGEIDEGNPQGGAACTTSEPGRCASGTETCVGGALTCVADTETAETCNGLDDDCDGAIDQGNPGGGAACNTGLFGVCGPGAFTCQGGLLRCVANVTAGVETCNGVDDDCDGAVDQGDPGGGGACTTTLLGACSSGTLACQNGALACTETVSPAPEACNGLDDDCDGAADQGNPEGGGPCNTGLFGVCAPGTVACQGGALACIQNGTATAETCNGIDDDCDGTVDDGDPVVGLSCTTGLPGACGAGMLACQNGVPTCVVAGGGPTPETCNGIDDDCDGTVDDGSNGCGGVCPLVPAANGPCDAAGDLDACDDDLGVCAGLNATTCAEVDTDTDDDGYSPGDVACGGDCDDGTMTLAPNVAEVCDLVDNDCDGLYDETCSCESFTFDGGADTTAWEDPLNWFPDGVPGSGPNHCVTIPAGSTATITGPLPFALRTLAVDGTLTHPAANADGVMIDVVDDATIGATGSVDVTGRGMGPLAGLGAGATGTACACGSIAGSGAGHGGPGGAGQGGTPAAGGTYGSIPSPVDLGSGAGGRNCSGQGTPGRGGGRVRLTVGGTLTIDGSIRADGTTSATACSHGGGSGGSIWVSAGAVTTTGAGLVTANGGSGTNDGTCGCGTGVGGGGGAGGRIAVDGFANAMPVEIAVQSRAGAPAGTGGRGAAGTIFRHPAGQAFGELEVDSGGVVGVETPLVPTALGSYERVTIRPTTVLATTIPLAIGTLEVEGVLTHAASDTDGVTVTGGDVFVAPGGIIDASGRGYGGTTGPGAGANGPACACGGIAGSGAGHGGPGGAGQGSTPAGGGTYGVIDTPLDLGSGGGRRACSGQGTAGLGGGLVRLILSGTLTVDGAVRANGTTPSVACSDGGGSGGSVWITTDAIATASTGVISANGGNGSSDSTCGCGPGVGGGSGAGGRVAIDGFTTPLPAAVSVEARAGTPAGTATLAGAGTIFTRPLGQALGDLEVDSGGVGGAFTPLVDGAVDTYESITVRPGTTLTTHVPLDVGTLFVEGTLTHPAGDTDGIHVDAGDVTVASTGAIDASGRGYGPNAGPGAGANGPACGCGSGIAGSGAGYGGPGGAGQGSTPAGGGTYGVIDTPLDLGSGGGRRNCSPQGTAGLGGGLVRLILGGTLTVDGAVRANGTTPSVACSDGGGSGGSVWITTNAIATASTGVISANGGNGSSDSTCGCSAGVGGGSGGGGRVAIDGFTTPLPTAVAVQARAGTPAGTATLAGAGTIFTRPLGQVLGDLEVDSGGVGGAFTPLVDGAVDTYESITVRPGTTVTTYVPIDVGMLLVEGTLTHPAGDTDGVLVMAGDVTVASTGAIDASGRGYGQTSGPGAGANGVACACGSLAGSGGGHAGAGGPGQGGAPAGGGVYGSLQGVPLDFGSGGGRRNCSGQGTAGLGGGLVQLLVEGTVQVEGAIRADGTTSATACSHGGGAGGSVWITAGNVTTAATGIVSAAGGNGTNDATCGCGAGVGGGGGGGGRVAVFAHASDLPPGAVSVAAGLAAGAAGAGQAGWAVHVPGSDSFVTLVAPLDGAAGSSGGTLLEWSGLPSADHFHVEVDDDPHIDASGNHPEVGSAPVAVVDETPGAAGGPLTSTSWITPALPSATTHYWHVVAHDASHAVVGGSRLYRFSTP